MSDFINIAIIILTLSLTIIPFTGDLRNKETNRIRLYIRGYLFLFVALITVILGTIKDVKESNDQKTRDLNQNTTLINTENIINNLDVSTSSIEKKLLRIDSLNSKLDSLESKTITSIDKRDKILDNYNRLSNQLERLYIQQDLKIKENMPNVNILQKVRWIKEDGIYKVQIVFSNNGERLAQDFNVSIFFIRTDSLGHIIDYSIRKNDLYGSDDFPSSHKIHKDLKFNFPIYSLKSQNDTLHSGYLSVYYSYKDFVTNKKYRKNEKFMWEDIDTNGLYWRYVTKSISNQIEDYIKKNNID